MISEDELTVPEQGVLAAFRVGGPGIDVEGAEIRGDFLRGLFCGDYHEKADYRGTRIVGAIISDEFNMEFCETKFPVQFRNCLFAREIKFRQLVCPELNFSACALKKSLDAQVIKVAGSVNLKKVNATLVSLAGAKIGGQLACSGGNFQNDGKDAFHATGVKVVSDMFLCSVFIGKVNLSGADIGGQLDCAGGIFLNGGGRALHAQNIKVVGDAFLCYEFRAVGDINLAGADIGGQLNCAGGSFQSGGGDALNAQNIKVAGDVFLREGFNAKGAVSLASADIGGQLDCAGGSFQNKEGGALIARNIKVAGDVLLIPHEHDKEGGRENFSAKGVVSFVNATIGGDIHLIDCKLTHLLLAGADVSGKFQDGADVYKNDNGNDIDLNIDGFCYRRLNAVKERVKDRLAWVGSMSKGDEFRPQPYEQLMKVYRESGHMNWARRVGFELEKKRHKQLRLNRDHKRFVVLGWAWWLWYWILRGTIGYGYKPFRAITRWFAPLFVAGLVLFSGILPCPDLGRAGSEACHCMAPSDAEVLLSDDWKIHGKLPNDYPGFNPFYYAVETALPVLPLGQTENWHPKTWWVRWLQGAITIIGALVLTILASYGVGVLGPRWKDE